MPSAASAATSRSGRCSRSARAATAEWKRALARSPRTRSAAPCTGFRSACARRGRARAPPGARRIRSAGLRHQSARSAPACRSRSPVRPPAHGSDPARGGRCGAGPPRSGGEGSERPARRAASPRGFRRALEGATRPGPGRPGGRRRPTAPPPAGGPRRLRRAHPPRAGGRRSASRRAPRARSGLTRTRARSSWRRPWRASPRRVRAGRARRDAPRSQGAPYRRGSVSGPVRSCRVWPSGSGSMSAAAARGSTLR